MENSTIPNGDLITDNVDVITCVDDMENVSEACGEEESQSNLYSKADLEASSDETSQGNTSGEANPEDISKAEFSDVISIDITPEKDGGVLKRILKEGAGEEYPGYGDRVSVHYTGWRLAKEPVEFDSSRKGEKFEFNLGRGLFFFLSVFKQDSLL